VDRKEEKMEDNQSQAQQEALAESLSRGEAFEETVRTKGWEYIKSYFQTKFQLFATSLLIEDKKGIEEFEKERRELIGIRKLFGLVDGDIKTLEDKLENDKKTRPVTKK
jgi:hypothetical protein